MWQKKVIHDGTPREAVEAAERIIQDRNRAFSTFRNPSAVTNAHPNLARTICVAESASAVVSIGAALLVGQNPRMIEPARDFVAKHIILPFMGNKTQDASQTPDPKRLEKAQEKASVMLKGVIMTGAELVAFVPIQMVMEGKCDMKEFKKVLGLKSVGLTTALASLASLNKLAPGAMHKVDAAANAIAGSLCGLHNHPENSDDKGPDSLCERNKENAKLGVVQLISSVISGGVNIGISRFCH